MSFLKDVADYLLTAPFNDLLELQEHLAEQGMVIHIQTGPLEITNGEDDQTAETDKEETGGQETDEKEKHQPPIRHGSGWANG